MEEISDAEFEEMDEAVKTTQTVAKYMNDVINALSTEKARPAGMIAKTVSVKVGAEVEAKNVQGPLNVLVKAELATVKQNKAGLRFYRLNQDADETRELRAKIAAAGKEVTKVSQL